MTTTHYVPPQTIHPLGLVLGGAAAFAGGVLIAPLYSLAIAYIPFVYLNAILTGVTGLGVGLLTVGALRLGGFQHGALSYLLGLGALLFAYWMHWIAWIWVLGWRADAEISFFSLVWPPALFEMIGYLYDSGTWSLRSSDPVSGLALGFVWLVEAALFFGGGIFGMFMLVGSGTFCSRCDKWCDEVYADAYELDATGGLIDALNAADFSGLPGSPRTGPMWHRVEIRQCPECQQTATLTLATVTRTHDAKGNAEESEDIEVDRVYISASEVVRIAGGPSNASG